ncbi:hypothetical protein [Oryza sativa Japonica Group]|uniref:Uncharacterized protein n=1 Tax=Oryza sativa subsp. japonica TaxID=39947 RepID=Q5N7B1_ORYSJ|nr:hypothetical protein [Oryza sativa Japonica Group]
MNLEYNGGVEGINDRKRAGTVHVPRWWCPSSMRINPNSGGAIDEMPPCRRSPLGSEREGPADGASGPGGSGRRRAAARQRVAAARRRAAPRGPASAEGRRRGDAAAGGRHDGGQGRVAVASNRRGG